MTRNCECWNNGICEKLEQPCSEVKLTQCPKAEVKKSKKKKTEYLCPICLGHGYASNERIVEWINQELKARKTFPEDSK